MGRNVGLRWSKKDIIRILILDSAYLQANIISK